MPQYVLVLHCAHVTLIPKCGVLQLFASKKNSTSDYPLSMNAAIK